MSLSSHAEVILRSRYYKKDPITREPLETAEELLWRVANAVALAEKPEKREHYAQLFHDAMSERRWLPNSPTLMNAGMEFGDMCACVVLPIKDSMESIYGTLYNQAMLHRFGVGTGFDFSDLRERGAFVFKTSGEASGPVSFLKVYDASTNEIKQGGRRRGANMATLRFDHPDVEEFINCKDSGNTQITNFNISLTLEDEHMIAVEKDLEIDLVSPATKLPVRKVKARDLLKMAAQKAWETGDPGVMFLGAMNRGNPTPGLGRLVTSNPCSESQLLPNEECTLGSLNLERYVRPHHPDQFGWDYLATDVRLLTRFLDNVVDQNYYVNDDLRKMHKEGNRKIGAGVMGWADSLIHLNIPYESQAAYDLGSKVMKFINEIAHDEDRVLADERGVFANFTHYAFVEEWGKQRNAHVTVIAPTGTIALIADCSSGVEPLFAITMERTGLDGHKFVMVHPYFEEYALKHGWPQEVRDHVMKTGRLSDCDHPSVTDLDKKIWATAHDVSWKGHLNMLLAFQKHVDNGVSKTINLPHDATPEDIYKIYFEAWKMGLKTVSIYRDKSKSVQVLNAGVVKEEVKLIAKPKTDRPEILDGHTHKIKTDLGPAYITVNSFEDKPAEVFANVGRNGSAVQTMSEALGRVVSVALQHGVSPEALSRTLYGVGGNGRLMTTVPSAIAKVLGNGHFAEIAAEKDPVPVLAGHIQGDICPDCHSASLVPTGDCSYCSICGYSKC